MYIAPNSKLYIMHGVPLDNTYKHTYYFDTKEWQENFLTSDRFVKYRFSEYDEFNNLSYVRMNSGVIRVGRKVEDLYDCNYLAFQNTSFGNKWFYCFINNVEYINNTTSDIYYEIDVMQTWHFDYTLGECFIEREHVAHANDDYFHCLVPENLETGEYINNDSVKADFTTFAHLGGNEKTPWSILMKSPYDLQTEERTPSFDPGGFNLQDKCYSGVISYVRNADTDGGNEISDLITTDDAKSEQILSIEMIPTFIDLTKPTQERCITRITKPTKFGNYTPLNKKLWTSPFCYLLVDNNNGNSNIYNLEWFAEEIDGTPKTTMDFWFVGNVDPAPIYYTIPLNYKGLEKDFSEALVTNNFPMCAFAIDAYKSWLAQNKASMAVNTVVATLSGIATVATGVMGSGSSIGHSSASIASSRIYRNSTGRVTHSTYQNSTSERNSENTYKKAPFAIAENVVSELSSVANTLATIADHKAAPTQIQEKGNGSSLNLAIGCAEPIFYIKQITETMAYVIDDYFIRFGYAINRVKIPNVARNSFYKRRMNWNYIKTSGCVMAEIKCPSDDASTIRSIYDNGITFWNPNHLIGYYSYTDYNIDA